MTYEYPRSFAFSPQKLSSDEKKTIACGNILCDDLEDAVTRLLGTFNNVVEGKSSLDAYLANKNYFNGMLHAYRVMANLKLCPTLEDEKVKKAIETAGLVAHRAHLAIRENLSQIVRLD